jgi:predicted N-acetyltransferase YhbS
MPVVIRQERPEDEAAVAELIEAAFGDAAVAEFAGRIRASPGYVPELSFVAEEDDEIVGHTMLSEVRLADTDRRVLTLTPMSVRPDRQRQGIGRELVGMALDRAEDRRLVVLVSTPAAVPFFGWFGFTGESHGHRALYLRPGGHPHTGHEAH